MYSRKIDGVITIVGYDITNVLKIELVTRSHFNGQIGGRTSNIINI